MVVEKLICQPKFYQHVQMRMGICLCALIIVLKSKGDKYPFRLCIEIVDFKL